MPVLFAGGVCWVVADLVVVDFAGGVDEAGLAAGAGAAAGAGVDAVVFAAGTGAGAAVVEALGAADALAEDGGGVAAVSVAVDFFERDFFAAVEESAVAAVPVEAAGALEVAAGAWSAVVAVFLDLLDFFVVVASEVVDWSAAAAVESADFVDLDFFFELVVAVESAGACESLEASVVDFLLLLDFLVVEESEVDVVSSAVVDFFFFLDLVVLVSLWSAGGCADGC
jgi:hypothetical protein